MRVNAKLAIAAVTLLSSGLAVADINLPFAPPPTPMSRTVDVPEGGRIDIPLTLTGAPGGRTLEFVVRVPPTKGRLDPVRNAIGGDAAMVTYTHNPAAGGGRDQFTFAVQRGAGGYSSSATIDIRIAENPPRLLVLPALVDFGPAALDGPPQRAQFTLVNQGGGVASGRILLQPPFRLEGDETYRLTRGQRKSFAVLFQPPRASAFEGEVRFGASFDQILRLTGSGLPTESPALAAAQPATPSGPTPTPTPAVVGQLPSSQTTPAPSPTAAPPLTSGASPSRPTPEPTPAEDTTVAAGEDLLGANLPGGAIPLLDFRLAIDEKKNITATWLAPTVGPETPAAYRIERREIYFDPTKALRARWVPVKWEGKPGSLGPRLTARLLQLPAGQVTNLRVVAVGADGTMRGYSAFEPLEVPASSGSWWRTVALILGLGIVAAAIWRRIGQGKQSSY